MEVREGEGVKERGGSFVFNVLPTFPRALPVLEILNTYLISPDLLQMVEPGFPTRLLQVPSLRCEW